MHAQSCVRPNSNISWLTLKLLYNMFVALFLRASTVFVCECWFHLLFFRANSQYHIIIIMICCTKNNNKMSNHNVSIMRVCAIKSAATLTSAVYGLAVVKKFQWNMTIISYFSFSYIFAWKIIIILYCLIIIIHDDDDDGDDDYNNSLLLWCMCVLKSLFHVTESMARGCQENNFYLGLA